MSAAPLDAARGVRKGEELDTKKVTAFLAANGLVTSGEVSISQFPGGHSNLTYLVTLPESGELVLRRPPFGNRVKTAHDMSREYRILRGLSKVYAPAPRPVAYCDDESVIGAPFYVMQRIRGVVVRRALPEGVTMPPAEVRALCTSFVDNLAALHAIDPKAAELGDLGKPEGYVVRQVKGWTERYVNAKTDDIPEMDVMAKWLADRMEEAGKDARAAIIHNDYKYDNLVLDPSDLSRIVGLLDWEMATVGDPLMDLGTALGYWVEASDDDSLKSLPFGVPTSLPGSMTRKELAARYAEKSGRDVSNLLFFYCFALFKTAGVAQQIYWRFAKGLTQDPRFGAFLMGTKVLAQAAVRAAERGTI